MGDSIARIADSISCGDHIATGSSNVFANGMPISHMAARDTTGHSCFPPTILISGWSSTVFVNSNVVAIKNQTKILPHTCGGRGRGHDGIVVTGSPDVFVEKA